jgi:cysteine sulfinate desulfinase/cysteine desulfurase-like protein
MAPRVSARFMSGASRGCVIEAQMHGGGHERGMRSGTLATHQIVGMGEAFRIAKQEMGVDMQPHHRAA